MSREREAAVGFGTLGVRVAAAAAVDRAMRESAANHVEAAGPTRGVTGFDPEAVRNTPISTLGSPGVQRGTSPHVDGLRNLEREGR